MTDTKPAAMTGPGVTVFCDSTLAPAMRRLAPILKSKTGMPMAVLSAPAQSMLAQIFRNAHCDVLITLSASMDQAVQSKLVKQETRVDGFSNHLVLACMSGRFAKASSRSDLHKIIAGAKIAVNDPTVAAEFDGHAVLDRNGLEGGSQVFGAANTGDVAFLVTSGAADIGLVYLTDVQADKRLSVVTTLDADGSLTTYSGAITTEATGSRSMAFLSLVKGGIATPILRQAGLDVAA